MPHRFVCSVVAAAVTGLLLTPVAQAAPHTQQGVDPAKYCSVAHDDATFTLTCSATPQAVIAWAEVECWSKRDPRVVVATNRIALSPESGGEAYGQCPTAGGYVFGQLRRIKVEY